MPDYDASFLRFFETAKIAGKLEVNTTFVVKVLKVSDDGKYVDVMHCTLEWKEDPSSTTILQNSFLEEVACTPTKPWVIHDVPVEKHEYGNFKMRVRPKVGDVGKMTVYYHDISSLKREGGFQAPDIINVHSLLSCTYHPMGEIGHPQNDAQEQSDPYPADGVFEITGGRTKIQMTDGVDSKPAKTVITVGTVSLTITDDGSGAPTVVLTAPDGALTVNCKTATVNADASATINTPTTSISGDVSVGGNLSVSGDATVGATLTAATDVVGGGVSLKTHTHPFPYNAGSTPSNGTTLSPA